MTHDIRAVANYLIALDIMNGRKTSHIRIQKLCFVTHGWSLALLNQSITFDTVSLYKYGPLYEKIYKSCVYYYGSGIITAIHEKDIELDYNRGEIIVENFSEKEKHLINAVYNNYKDWTTSQLSSHILNKEKPWYEKSLYMHDDEFIQLSVDDIKKEFIKMKKSGDKEMNNNNKYFMGKKHTPITDLVI